MDIVGRIPGPIGPGLIEALERLSAALAEQGEFRGQLAPASLKQLVQPHPPLARTKFRGQLAPASLKPGIRAYTLNCSLEFRGQLAPASLKQDPRGAHRPHRRGNSGANWPRPH